MWGRPDPIWHSKNTGLPEKETRRESEYHLSLKRSLKNMPKGGSTSLSPPARKSSRPPYSSISVDQQLNAQAGKSPSREDLESNCEQSFATTLDSGGQIIAMDSDGVAALGTGATAHFLRF